ncbi:MAG: putative ABC transporter ATP-binding protein [Firmicutes bacterium ADurb.Bin099]|nr:MAG: putative ABC transporter ATP-binding protein [Firmicutes bacterium ADurb.Bin099]
MTTQNPSDRKYDRPPQGGRGGGGPRATMRLVEKPKDFKGAMNKLLKYLKPYWFLLLVSVIFSVASTVFNILSPKQMGLITTELYVGMTQKNGLIDFNYIGRIILILLLLYIGYTLFHVIQGLISNTVSQKIGYEMRKSMADKCNRLPLSYFDTNLHGDILSRLTNDIDTITMTLNQSLSQITTTVTQILGVFIMMLLISPLMTAVAVLILPLSSVFVAVLVKKSQKFFKAQQENLGNLNGHVEEMFSGHLVLKVFNGEERSVDKFRTFNDKLFESSRKSQFLSGLMFPVTGFIGDIGYVAICVLGGYLVLSNSIQVGDIQAFIRYVRQFNNPLRQTAGIANTLQSTAAAAERVFDFLEEAEEIPDPENAYNISDFKGNVSFKNVFFGYDKNVSIIKDFTVDVKAGQKIAIVGPTGAGKTTLVNLLMRFYDVDSGSISIDGVDIRDMKRSDLRNLFGMVLQDTWLFNGTLRENIAYPDSDADFEDIQKAATLACAEHFILSGGDGYDMIINEEASNISSGQKQLITIARTIMADNPMLILDEATSNVDTRTEILIQKAMDNLMLNRTSFIIAHRLSTIKNADVIIVIDDGRIVEKGNHKELLAKQGFYHKLYYSQFDRVAANSIVS